MATRSDKISGTYIDRGKIRLANGKIVEWHDPSLRLPYGTKTEVTITCEECDYLNGTDGIVWATYDRHQAITIRDALLVQKISCEVREEQLEGLRLFLLHIPHADEVAAALDFIWRDDAGLRLQPDWWYPAGAENESFKKWINGM
jgi:hypothetical protein